MADFLTRAATPAFGVVALCAGFAAPSALGEGAGGNPFAAVRAAVARGERQIVVPAGRHRVSPPDGETAYLRLKGLCDVELDFGGAELVGTVRTQMLALENCTNVTVRNVSIDYEELPFTQGRIEEVGADGEWTVRILDGYPRPSAEAAAKVGDAWPIQCYDGKTFLLKNPMRFRDGIAIEKTGEDTYRITGGLDRRGDVGDIAVFSCKEQGRKTDTGAVKLSRCANVSLENVTVYATPHGPGFFDMLCERTVYRDCRLLPRPPEGDLEKRGLRRLRSGNQDAFMSRGAVVGPQLIGCTALYHCDDCVNIGGKYAVVVGARGRTLRLLADGIGACISAGDPLQVFTSDGRVLDGMAVAVAPGESRTAAELDFLKEQGFWPSLAESCSRALALTLDRDLALRPGALVISRRHTGDGFLVKGCRFGRNRSRGLILQASDGVVEDNLIDHPLDIGMKLSMSHLWLEGSCGSNVRVARNRIEKDGDGIGIYIGGTPGAKDAKIPAGAHRDFVVEDNDISGVSVGIVAEGCTGLSLKGNRVATSAAGGNPFAFENVDKVSGLSSEESQEVQSPAAAVPSLQPLAWKLPKRFASLEGGRLVIDVPRESYGADAVARAILPAALFNGAKGFAFSVAANGSGLAEPTQPWLGLKVQLHWREGATGREAYPNCRNRTGDFGRVVIRNDASFDGATPDFVELMLGLQGTSGRVEFDLSTLSGAPVQPLFRRINQDWRVRYPVSNQPCRGCMLPSRATTEEDIATLASWGATLVRFQMIRNWSAADDNQDIPEFTSWLDSRLDNLEDVLRWAGARGMKVVVDLHVPPGGKRPGDRQMNMFEEDRFADAFVEIWRRIAMRFRGNRTIYGYDLINEPWQHRRARHDYWTLQRRAAEAVREIDPTTPIIVEANQMAAPAAFAHLSPLRMDNVIYQVHLYKPEQYTHQGVRGSATGFRWPDHARGWDKDYLRRQLEPVRAFQLRHGARIYVGEFSAIAWAEGAENYLRDCIELFGEYGWDWTYHAFREWNGWSVEHEGPDAAHLVQSDDNPRKRVLLEGFKGGVATNAPAAAAKSVDWDSAWLSGSLGRDCPFFAPGEEMAFSIRLEGVKGDIPEGAYFVDWERRGDDGIVEKGRAPLPTAAAPLVVRTKMDAPGFVCVEANVVDAQGARVKKKHRWEPRVFFMGGAAVAPEELRPGTEPADYDDFWNAQMAALDAVPIETELTPTPCADAGVRLYAVRIACSRGRPVTGWLTIPADASPERRYPVSVGFRGATKDDHPAPGGGPHDSIQFISSGHGFDLGRGPDYVKAFFESVCKPGFGYGFDPESNKHRETSYWLGMALRAARAVQWAATLPEWDGKALLLDGTSQGGWQALMAASLVPHATKITTGMTWGCDWTGQAEYGRLKSNYRPNCWFPDMAYFDAVFAARRVRCPVEIRRAGLGDYVSPPSSLAVLFNALNVPKTITWNQGWTHGWSPAGMAKWTVDGGFSETNVRQP